MKVYGKRRIVVLQPSIHKESALDPHDWEEGWCRRSRSRSVVNFADDVVFARQAANRDGITL